MKTIEELKAHNYDLLMKVEALKKELKAEQDNKMELYHFWRANRYYQNDEFRRFELLTSMFLTPFMGTICTLDRNIYHGVITVLKEGVYVGVKYGKSDIFIEFDQVEWWKQATFDTACFERGEGDE